MSLTVDPQESTRASLWADGAAERVAARLGELALVTDTPGALFRPFMGDAMMDALALVEGWVRTAGLTTRRDGFGNLIGRLEGLTSDTLLIGSHLDTVPNAGRFDGQLGVVLGIELLEELARHGRPSHSVEVVAFSEEEGVRFGLPFIGSKGFLGVLGAESLARMDAAGVTVREALAQRGCDASTQGRGPGRYIGYHEVHLEQGPVLEDAGEPIGIVSGIAGQMRFAVTVTGRAGHAGTTPMHLRSDALAAAARMVLAVRDAGRSTPGLVATVGRLEVADPAVNVIPGAVEFTIDIRHAESAALESAVASLHATLDAIASAEGLRLAIREISRQAPIPCDPMLMAVQRAATPGAPVLLSGAGHDALALYPHLPVSMLFVRCRAGLSHHPDEFVSTHDIAAALDATRLFVSQLAQSTGETS